MVKIWWHMYVNGKMISFEVIKDGGGGDEGKW
jgi:hypothetical protein